MHAPGGVGAGQLCSDVWAKSHLSPNWLLIKRNHVTLSSPKLLRAPGCLIATVVTEFHCLTKLHEHWQRDHGSDIVARVQSSDQPNLWAAATWSRSDPTVLIEHHRVIETLSSAKAKADHLARVTFKHVCTLETCGDWLFVP